DQTAIAWLKASLGELAYAVDALGKSGEAHAGGCAIGWARLHAYPGLGDDPKRALRAGEQAIGTGARAGAGQAPRRPCAGGGERPHGLHEVLDVGPRSGEVTGGARGDPAAERGQLERLWEVAQGQAVLGQLGLQVGAGRAPLDESCTRDLVDLEHAAQAAEVDRDGAVVGGADVGLDSPHDTGAAAVGNRGHTLGRAPGEQPLHVELVARASDEVRRVLEAAAKAQD